MYIIKPKLSFSKPRCRTKLIPQFALPFCLWTTVLVLSYLQAQSFTSELPVQYGILILFILELKVCCSSHTRHCPSHTEMPWSKWLNSNCDLLAQRRESLQHGNAITRENPGRLSLHSAAEWIDGIRYLLHQEIEVKGSFFQLLDSTSKRTNGCCLAMSIFRLEIRRLLTIRRKRFCDSQPRGDVEAN